MYFGVNNLDQRLEKYLNYKDGFFVELGANNGIDQSNTLHFEKYKGWHGILIEPALNNYLECKKNRSIKTKIYCNACVAFDYSKKFVEIIYANLMSFPQGIESDVDAIEHKSAANITEVISFGATAKTLNSILKDANAPKIIDFLSLDVEGGEIEVLKGINHSDFKFKLMCIESRSFDKLNEFLVSNGYEFVEKVSHHDYIFRIKLNS